MTTWDELNKQAGGQTTTATSSWDALNASVKSSLPPLPDQKPEGLLQSALDVVKNIPSAAMQIGSQFINQPLKTGQSIVGGLLDVGPTAVNSTNNLGKSILSNIFGSKSVENSGFQLPLIGQEANKYIGNTSEPQQAIQGASKAVGAYELGGAAIPGIGLLSRTTGAVAGGQLLTDAKTLEERAKQAAFDAAFNIITEGLTGKLKAPEAPLLAKENQIKLPVTSQSEASQIPVSTPLTRMAEYSKGQGYEPIPQELPTIQMGPRPTESIPTIQMGESAPSSKQSQISSLLQEAKKYKSVEEFVNSQKPVFRGVSGDVNTGKVTDVFEPSQRGAFSEQGVFSVARDKKVARQFGDKVIEGRIAPNAKIKQLGFVTEDVEGAIAKAKKEGFDAIEFTSGADDLAEIVVINPKVVQTKSQLTDIWNKANVEKTPILARPSKQVSNITYEPIKQPRALPQEPLLKSRTSTNLKPIEGTGDIKVRGLSQGVEAKAIEKGIADNFGDLPEYKSVNMQDQARRAGELMAKDYEGAKSIALGEKAPPRGTLPESVFVAVEKRALAEGDIETLQSLANSKLASSATTMGQRIRTLAERDPNSPIGAIQEVQKARQEAISKRVDVKKEVQTTIKDVREHIKKVAPPKQTWNEFVDSITC